MERNLAAFRWVLQQFELAHFLPVEPVFFSEPIIRSPIAETVR